MNKSKPNVYIIGVQKSGTTSLYHTLKKHEKIFGPDIKDYKKSHPFFFDHNYFESKELHFLKLFNDHKNEELIITSDVDIIESEEAMKRVNLYSQNAKIIVCVRNPISRIESMFKFYKQLGRIKEDLSFEKALNNNYDMFMKRSLYHDKLNKVFSIFGYENVKVVHFEEIIDPKKNIQVFNQIYHFLNIDEKRIKLMHKNRTQKTQKSILKRVFELGRGSEIRTKTINIIDKFVNANQRTKIKEYLFDNRNGKLSTEKVNIPAEIQTILKNDAKKVLERFNIDLLKS